MFKLIDKTRRAFKFFLQNEAPLALKKPSKKQKQNKNRKTKLKESFVELEKNFKIEEYVSIYNTKFSEKLFFKILRSEIRD